MVQARTTLWYVVFCGFAVNYMIRLNINIAIVGMVRLKTQGNLNIGKNRTDLLPENFGNVTTSLNNVEIQDNLFDWDAAEQNYILGAFFWFHWISQIPGGMMARKYGTKRVFGCSNVGISLMSFLIPFCAHWNFAALWTLRALQGLVSGFSWPAMHHMTAQWIPQHERSKFVSAYLGSSFGAALTYPLCGFIMDQLSWEWVFYVTASIGVVWGIFWFCVVYDTPTQHPTISPKEREYIINSCGATSNQKRQLPGVPWKEILTSRPVIMNMIGQFGGIWGLFTLMTQAPTYFKTIHGINIRMNGLYSGLPHLCRWGFSHVFAILCDKMLQSGKFSKTLVRKIATSFSTIAQGMFTLALAFSGQSTALAVIFMMAATMVNGAVSSGLLASLVDLSPNFASVLQGICGMVSVFPGFISPVTVAYFTLNNQTEEQWKKVFILTAFVLIVSGILYDLLATSELQPWNEGAARGSELERINPPKTESIKIIPRDEKNETKTDKKENESVCA